MLVQDVVQSLVKYPRDVVSEQIGSYSVALDYRQTILDKCFKFFHLTLIQLWECGVMECLGKKLQELVLYADSIWHSGDCYLQKCQLLETL
jgi:hypothetical protein